MERETKTVTTPGGHQVVIKSYMTAREANTLKEAIWGNTSINFSGETPQLGEMSGKILLDQEKKTLELMVVSVDGQADKVVDCLEELNQDDYYFVLSEVNNASKSNFLKAK